LALGRRQKQAKSPCCQSVPHRAILIEGRAKGLFVGLVPMEAAMQDYRNDKIVVRYDPKICIHAGDCVRELPNVFDVGKKPWINVDGASPILLPDKSRSARRARSPMIC
jgi:uncharacterized Fe-S cluster protein YjdI